ncbi:protein MOTHER of FT and TFL1 homolog 1 [Musa acuminata AAA Group]
MCYSLSLSLSLGMARYVDPLVVGRVIGDVVDLFVPTVSMTVRFGSKHVSNGCDIKPSMAANPPTVQIAGQQSDLYTLVMTDPDAPSPSDPTMREWLHWMMVNMPGGTYPSQGEEVVPYMGPRLPLGIHRYVMVLFRQKSRFPGVTPPATRLNFNTRSFAAHHDLGLPVATVYFNSQKEPATRRR